MNKKENKIINEFPYSLDKFIKEKYGEETECESFCAILGDMNHHTNFKDNGHNKAEIEAYIEGFIAGNVELRNKLNNIQK
jgi:hypothetical protein